VARKKALQLAGVQKSTTDLLARLQRAVQKQYDAAEDPESYWDGADWSPLAVLACLTSNRRNDPKVVLEAAKELARYTDVQMKPTEAVAPQQQQVVILGNDKQAERRATVIGDDSRKVWVGESFDDESPRRITARPAQADDDDDGGIIDIKEIEREVEAELAEERRRNG
jgi:hypothetical protein